MKQEIIAILKKVLKKLKIEMKEEEIEKYLEVPKSSEMGDYAFPCFFLASKLKQDPKEIALHLRELIREPNKLFEDIQVAGAYINFFIDRKIFSLELLKDILSQKDNFGKFQKKNKKIMVEFPSPNTNKPLHLGHLRNMSIGESISRICEFNGFDIIRANLNNDRGIHICKSMLAYKKFGKNKKPSKKKKSDHFVGDFYVLFNEKSKKDNKLEREAQELLKKYEQRDTKTLKLWMKMNSWALNGFKETYKRFGIKHDIEYFESEIYSKGKEIVENGLSRGVFFKNKEGAIVSSSSINSGNSEKILIRSDGTSIYITQDIYLAKLRFGQFDLERLFYIVANEQDYHFQVLFEILKKIGFNFCDKLKHLSYGMVFLPSGRMKSREGTIVDADHLIEEVQNLAKKELLNRDKLSKTQLEEKSLRIALSAIKYLLLKIDIQKNMIFNPEESVNFEGDTGPYILYSYARASSILRKANKPKSQELNELEKSEIELVKKLSTFKELVSKSYNLLNPSIIANYSYDLAQIFNKFYHECPVIGSGKEDFRLKLVSAFRQVLKNSLYLIGIDVLEKM